LILDRRVHVLRDEASVFLNLPKSIPIPLSTTGMRQSLVKSSGSRASKSAKVDTNTSVHDRDETINDEELGQCRFEYLQDVVILLLWIDGDETRGKSELAGFD
jgi:hypothetical protein